VIVSRRHQAYTASMRRLLFAMAFFCLIQDARADISTSAPANTLSTIDQIRLYEGWFVHPYEYMFGPGAFSVNGVSYGSLLAGIGGIVKYGGLIDAAARYLKLPRPSHGDLGPIERLAGLPIYKKVAAKGHLAEINPAFVRWAVANTVPPPSAQLLGHSCQEYYDRVFQRFFRLMAASRAYLTTDVSMARERDAYQKAARAPRFDGLEWLEHRYARALPAYAIEHNGTNFTAPMAIGFWLRRNSDGTETELLQALQRLLSQYDPTFAGVK